MWYYGNMKSKKHQEVLGVWISSPLKALATEAADRDRRSLSDWVRMLIEDELKRRELNIPSVHQ